MRTSIFSADAAVRRAACLVVGVACALSSACSRRVADRPSVDAAAVASDAPEDERLMTSVVGLLSGEADASSLDSALAQLNRYISQNPQAVPEIPNDDRRRLATVLGPQAADVAASREFRPEDAESLRTASLARKVVQAVQPASTSKLDLAERLFEWTVRHIVLVPTNEEAALTPADAALRGLGDYRDRMWMFFELLRQADLEGVVVAVSRKQSPDSLVPWLCAALVDGEGRVFDPVAGVPAPSRAGRAGEAATIRELIDDPSIVAALYADADDAIVNADDVERFKLLVPFDATKISPRAAFLQSRLTGAARLNVALDYFAAVGRAEALLADAPAPVGAQAWRYPFETIAAQRSLTRAAKSLHWMRREHDLRSRQIQGESREILRPLVERDIESESALWNEVEHRERGFPIEWRRKLLGRTRPGVVYFVGAAQLEANPDHPEVALEWFERCLREYGTWQVKDRDVLEFNVLARQLAGETASESPSVAQRLAESLSPRARELVAKAAKVETRAHFVEPMTSESPLELAYPNTLEPNELSEALDDVNRVLAGVDLLAEDRIRTELKVAERPALARLAEVPREALSPEALAWRNRLAFDVAFRESIVPADRPWLVGAARGAAACLNRLGRDADAVEILRRERPTLAPIQRASLQALANVLERTQRK